jgi:predicted Zn-dependent protease with MMP-like domain
MKRMGMKKFGRIVAHVMETLPEAFREHLDNVVVDVEREPSIEEMLSAGLTEEEIEDGETIYGLFEPMDMPAWAGDFVDLDSVMQRLIIYKRPLEDDFPEPRQFLTEVRKTVIHELAHHFGWTDRDLERFDDTPDPFRDGLMDRFLEDEET